MYTRWVFKSIHITGWKIDTAKIHVVVKDGYIFYANEYLGTGYLWNGTKIRQLQVNKIKRRGNNSKLTIKIDIWEFRIHCFIRWMGKNNIFCPLEILINMWGNIIRFKSYYFKTIFGNKLYTNSISICHPIIFKLYWHI